MSECGRPMRGGTHEWVRHMGRYGSWVGVADEWAWLLGKNGPWMGADHGRVWPMGGCGQWVVVANGCLWPVLCITSADWAPLAKLLISLSTFRKRVQY
jgi:hypothetical protein